MYDEISLMFQIHNKSMTNYLYLFDITLKHLQGHPETLTFVVYFLGHYNLFDQTIHKLFFSTSTKKITVLFLASTIYMK